MESLQDKARRWINNGESQTLSMTARQLVGAISQCKEAVETIIYLNRWATENPVQPAPPAESLHEMAKRMCDSYKHHCPSCPNNPFSGADFCVLQVLGFEDCGDIEAQIDCLRHWAAEHPPTPVKTYREDFFEKFPGAPTCDHGFPALLITSVYKVADSKRCEYSGISANTAWDKPLGYWAGTEGEKDG